jgi:hypothetical protein
MRVAVMRGGPVSGRGARGTGRDGGQGRAGAAGGADVVLRSVYITKKTTLSPGSCYGPAKTHLVRTDSSRWTEPRGLRPARRECTSTSPQPVSVHTRGVLGVHVPSPCPYTHAAVRSGSRRHLASYWAHALEGTSRRIGLRLSKAPLAGSRSCQNRRRSAPAPAA